MITVLFFAHLKETLGCEQLELELAETVNVTQLREKLSEKGSSWAKNLAGGATLVAVNQSMANEQTTINPGDEVAFFPPVTGG